MRETRQRQGEREAGAAPGRSRILGRDAGEQELGPDHEGKQSTSSLSARWFWDGH